MNLLKPLLSGLLLICFSSLSAQNINDVTIKTTQISDHIYMLVGAGGNIGVSVGDDGVFVIDDQFAPLTPKILEALKSLSDKPVTYLVNTHYHGDHTGGNENMTKEGAIIMAHDNVRKRLAETPRRDNSLRPKEALPVITFNDKMSVHMNGEHVLIFHVENAHTDGDAIIYFSDSNVLHTGDTYFHKRYPYIDLNSGGSVDGCISTIKNTLMLIDDETKIIPGHGSISNKEEYQSMLDMLTDLRSLVLAEISKGKSEEDVATNTSLTKTYDNLGYGWNFITSEKIRRTFYKSLKK